MSTPGKTNVAIGQAGLGALQDINSVRNQNALRATNALRQRMEEMQIEQAQREMARQQQQQQFLQGLPSPQMQASQAAMAGGGGPTNANAAQMAPVDPMQQQLFQAMQQGLVSYPQYLASTVKDTKPISVKEGETLVAPGSYKPLYSNPKTPSQTPNIQEWNLAKQDGETRNFSQWKADMLRAGAASNTVSVNTGQKGFDNTLKLRGDFRSEPIYKAHQDVVSAHSQITTSLKQASPAGDLAGATKLMKILDPGSVVRESELGMAMAASGLLDRATNYATMVMNGQKLTPTQRKDFMTLADSLFQESQKQYNIKAGEYQEIAVRNGLNKTDVVGKLSGGEVDFGSLK
jgi:hypothetical protein